MAFFFRTLPYKGIFMILILWFRDRVRMKSSCTISQRHIFHPWTMDHVHHAQFFATLELSNQTNLRWRKNIKTLCLGTLGFNQIFASLILEAVISAGNLIWTWSLFGFFWVPIFLPIFSISFLLLFLFSSLGSFLDGGDTVHHWGESSFWKCRAKPGLMKKGNSI